MRHWYCLLEVSSLMRTYQKLMQRKTALKNVLRIAVMKIRELALRKIAKSNISLYCLKDNSKSCLFLYTGIINKFNSNVLYFSIGLNKQIVYICIMENMTCIRQQADIKQIVRCKDRVLELNDSFDYLSSGLELAGNNVRLRILFLLYEEKQLCVCDISDILDMTISAISQHLRKLKDRKLIETKREAQTIFYSLTKEYEKMLRPFFEILAQNEILEKI